MNTASLAAIAALSIVTTSMAFAHESFPGTPQDFATELHAVQQIREGRQTFRYATFEDEAFWGDLLGLHKAIAGAANGGVGAGVSPKTALSVGLKVDSSALPKRLQRSLRAGAVNLDDPAVTIELLRLDAVVGVTVSSTNRTS
jgi:hypothetical protein